MQLRIKVQVLRLPGRIKMKIGRVFLIGLFTLWVPQITVAQTIPQTPIFIGWKIDRNLSLVDGRADEDPKTFVDIVNSPTKVSVGEIFTIEAEGGPIPGSFTNLNWGSATLIRSETTVIKPLRKPRLKLTLVLKADNPGDLAIAVEYSSNFWIPAQTTVKVTVLPKILRVTFDPPKAWPLDDILARSIASAETLPPDRMVKWSIIGNTYGATIDSHTGVIIPAEGRSGSITVRATDAAEPTVFTDRVLTIQAVPTGISHSQVYITPLPRYYGGHWIHTFTSSGGSLEGIYIGETIRTITKPSPFRGILGLTYDPPAKPSGPTAPYEGSSWVLDPEGTMKVADVYRIAKSSIDARDFLSGSSKAGLPQTHKLYQWYSWYFPPGKRWIKFMGPNEITWTLRLNATHNRLEVVTQAYGQEVVQEYEGPTWMVEDTKPTSP
jgi:hypothetical protein